MGHGALTLPYDAQALVMFAGWLQFGRGGAGANGPRYFDDKFGARSFLGFDADTSAVRLEDLIHDGQAQAGAAGEAGLKGFEDARGLGRVNADSGVANLDARPMFIRVNADREHAARGHGAQSVVAEVPENLFQGVAIGAGAQAADFKLADDAQLADGASVVFKEQQSLFEERNDIDIGEMIGFDARIVQKVSDDLVEALRFATDDVDQLLVIFIEGRKTCEFFERAGHGG